LSVYAINSDWMLQKLVMIPSHVTLCREMTSTTVSVSDIKSRDTELLLVELKFAVTPIVRVRVRVRSENIRQNYSGYKQQLE